MRFKKLDPKHFKNRNRKIQFRQYFAEHNLVLNWHTLVYNQFMALLKRLVRISTIYILRFLKFFITSLKEYLIS